MIILNFLTFTIGALFGFYIYKSLSIKAIQLENNRILLDKKNNFKEVLSNLETGKTEYKSRVNDTCYISTSLINHGDVDIIYLMDKNDLTIFKNNKCIYTSDGVDKEIIMDIIGTIYITYNRKINDVVEILGFIFYREEFEKSFNIKVEDLKKMNLFNIQNDNNSEIENINNINNNKFDIDEILDKISEHGMDVLTMEERLFLDNYGNKKGN